MVSLFSSTKIMMYVSDDVVAVSIQEHFSIHFEKACFREPGIKCHGN